MITRLDPGKGREEQRGLCSGPGAGFTVNRPDASRPVSFFLSLPLADPSHQGTAVCQRPEETPLCVNLTNVEPRVVGPYVYKLE